MMSKPQPAWKQPVQQFLAGGSAGLVEVSIMHPLDLVKTRFQIQRGPDDPQRYKSLADCFKTMWRNEGFGVASTCTVDGLNANFGMSRTQSTVFPAHIFWRLPLSFYKGILPPILAETPKRAVKFFTFERYKALFSFGSPTPSAMAFTLAGLCSGLTEAVIINPFEVVKVKLQAQRIALSQQPSTIRTAQEIVRTDGFGLRGLNKGLTSTLGRHGVFNMIYFGFYHNVKNLIPESKDKKMDFLRKFGIGLTAGTLGSCVNIPFDVAKSRIQGPQPVPGEIKYRTCFATIATVYKEEGYLALYKGLLPKIMRLGPGGAIMLLVYEHAYDWLHRHW